MKRENNKLSSSNGPADYMTKKAKKSSEFDEQPPNVSAIGTADIEEKKNKNKITTVPPNNEESTKLVKCDEVKVKKKAKRYTRQMIDAKIVTESSNALANEKQPTFCETVGKEGIKATGSFSGTDHSIDKILREDDVAKIRNVDGSLMVKDEKTRIKNSRSAKQNLDVVAMSPVHSQKSNTASIDKMTTIPSDSKKEQSVQIGTSSTRNDSSEMSTTNSTEESLVKTGLSTPINSSVPICQDVWLNFDSVKTDLVLDYAKDRPELSNYHSYVSATRAVTEFMKGNTIVIRNVETFADLKHIMELLPRNKNFKFIEITTTDKYPNIKSHNSTMMEFIVKLGHQTEDSPIAFTYSEFESTEVLNIFVHPQNIFLKAIHKGLEGQLFGEFLKHLNTIVNTRRQVVLRMRMVHLNKVATALNWKCDEDIANLFRTSEEERTNNLRTLQNEALIGKHFTYNIVRTTMIDDSNTYFIAGLGRPILIEKQICEEENLEGLLSETDKKHILILFTAREGGLKWNHICENAEIDIETTLADPDISSLEIVYVKCLVQDTFSSWYKRFYPRVDKIPTLIKYCKKVLDKHECLVADEIDEDSGTLKNFFRKQ